MNATNDKVSTADRWLNGTGGELFARIWSVDGAERRAPVILLHDSLGSVALWRDFPEKLCAASGRSIIAYDRLGFGRSAAHSGRLAADFVSTEASADFAALKSQLAIERFVVFGHSVGGGMAVHCAARFEDACVALITESAQAFVEDRTVAGIAEAKVLFQDPAQIERLKRYHGDKAQWVLDAWIESWLHPGFASWSLRPVLPRVACPTLVIHGAEDEYGSPAHPRLIAELVGGKVELRIMADTRHVPHREKEAEVIATVRDFLADKP